MNEKSRGFMLGAVSCSVLRPYLLLVASSVSSTTGIKLLLNLDEHHLTTVMNLPGRCKAILSDVKSLFVEDLSGLLSPALGNQVVVNVVSGQIASVAWKHSVLVLWRRLNRNL